jgi:hypothetical protein
MSLGVEAEARPHAAEGLLQAALHVLQPARPPRLALRPVDREDVHEDRAHRLVHPRLLFQEYGVELVGFVLTRHVPCRVVFAFQLLVELICVLSEVVLPVYGLAQQPPVEAVEAVHGVKAVDGGAQHLELPRRANFSSETAELVPDRQDLLDAKLSCSELYDLQVRVLVRGQLVQLDLRVVRYPVVDQLEALGVVLAAGLAVLVGLAVLAGERSACDLLQDDVEMRQRAHVLFWTNDSMRPSTAYTTITYTVVYLRSC